MTITTDVNGRIKANSTDVTNAIASATSMVVGYALGSMNTTIAQGDYTSTDQVIVELAVRMLQALKSSGQQETDVVVLTDEQKQLIVDTIRAANSALPQVIYDSPDNNGDAHWLSPDWN